MDVCFRLKCNKSRFLSLNDLEGAPKGRYKPIGVAVQTPLSSLLRRILCAEVRAEESMKISDLPLCCPRCGAALDAAADSLKCARCDADFPSPFGVPILVSEAELKGASPPSDDFVQDVASALQAAGCHDRLKQCFSLRLEMPDLHLQAEAEQFGHRLASSGFKISGLSASIKKKAWPRNTHRDIDVSLEPLILPERFCASTRIGVNVRVLNKGDCAISSRGVPPLMLSYRWRKRPGWKHFWRPPGAPVEGARTPVLIEIPPGGMITQPVFIDVPEESGVYDLEFAAVLETVQWYIDCNTPYRCYVQDNPIVPRYLQNLAGPALNYLEQRQYGIKLLNDWMSSYIVNNDPLVVEIGGNYNAASESISARRIINLDVDVHGLMARNIVKQDSIVSIVADGMNVPLQNGSVDAFVFFAAFHHFPEPIQLLSRLKNKLKPGGLIFLMVEPIGHVAAHHNYTAYIEELEKGVYEQSFEIWEYEAFLKAAGLKFVEAVFDRGAAMIAAARA